MIKKKIKVTINMPLKKMHVHETKEHFYSIHINSFNEVMDKTERSRVMNIIHNYITVYKLKLIEDFFNRLSRFK